MNFLIQIVSILLISSIQTCFCLNNFTANDSRKSFSDADELIFANVLFRHGDRNIIDPYPTDPHKDESNWIGGFGALTNIGKQQAYELGLFMRKRYRKLIGNSYSPNKVFIQSSDTDRTLMTAQCTSAGLFPPSESEIWNEKLHWQPTPVHTTNMDRDHLLFPYTNCPSYQKLLVEYMKSAEVTALLNKHKALLEFMEKNSGTPIRTLKDVVYLYDALHVESMKGFQLPNWAIEVLKSNRTLEYLAAAYFESFTHTKMMKKLKGGYLIRDMLDHFKEKINVTLKPDRSLWLYSAHDLTLAIALNTLNLYDMKLPPYASSLHFELYKRGQKHYVQLLYRDPINGTDSLLKIPNCGTKCPFDKFFDLYKNILPSEDIDIACKD